MPCPVCQHNQIKIIDRALLVGADPTALSRRYGFNPPDLRHHQEHLRRKMARADQRFQANLHQGLFCKLSQVMEMVLYVVREAKKGGDYKFFLQASREFTPRYQPDAQNGGQTPVGPGIHLLSHGVPPMGSSRGKPAALGLPGHVRKPSDPES